VPCPHSLDDYLNDWIAAAGIGDDKKGPLFRSFKKGDKLTENAVTRSDMLYMIKRRAKAAGPAYPTPPAVILSVRPASPRICSTAALSSMLSRLRPISRRVHQAL
jgi:hypothetical protein